MWTLVGNSISDLPATEPKRIRKLPHESKNKLPWNEIADAASALRFPSKRRSRQHQANGGCGCSSARPPFLVRGTHFPGKSSASSSFDTWNRELCRFIDLFSRT